MTASLHFVVLLCAIITTAGFSAQAQYAVVLNDGKRVEGDIVDHSATALMMKVYSKSKDTFHELNLSKESVRSVYDIINDRDVTDEYIASSSAYKTESTKPPIEEDSGERWQSAPLDISGEEWVDVVYLKDGTILRGWIIENNPKNFLRIRIGDGRVLTCEYSRIERLATEENIFDEEFPREKSPALAFLLSFLVTGCGQVYNEQIAKGVLMLGGSLAGMYIALTDLRSPETGLTIWAGCVLWSLIDAPLTASAINRERWQRRYGHMIEGAVGTGTLGIDYAAVDRTPAIRISYHF